LGSSCSTNWKKEKCVNNLVGYPEGERELERTGRGLEDINTMELGEELSENVKYIFCLRMRSVTGSCEHSNEP
jgi:hypothetical protein